MKRLVRWGAAAVLGYAGAIALAHVLVHRALRTYADLGGDDT